MVANFQDVVGLNSNTLTAGVERIIIGTSNDANKILVFAQDPAQASALFLSVSNPSGDATVVIPAANGTVGLLSQISFPGSAFSGGAFSIANTSGIVWLGNGSTLSASMSQISGMTINDFGAAIPQSLTGTMSIGINASTNGTLSTGENSAIRMGVTAPLNITYLDPGGQQSLVISGAVGNGTFTLSASLQWWAGVFTMNGSTASLVSSTSNSTLVSVSSSTAGTTTATASVVVDGRFTNLTWDFTLGDYLLVVGTTLSASVSYTGNLIVGQSYSASLLQTVFGATRAQVSYSVPYFADGTVSTSAGSYQLSNIVASGGTSVTSVAPRIVFVGT